MLTVLHMRRCFICEILCCFHMRAMWSVFNFVMQECSSLNFSEENTLNRARLEEVRFLPGESWNPPGLFFVIDFVQWTKRRGSVCWHWIFVS